MKKHFTYLAVLTILLVGLLYYNTGQHYLLNEPLFLRSLTASDLSDSSALAGKITPVAEDSSHHNIFHIKLKNNNIQNILGNFQIFSEENLNIDFDQEYVLRTDANGSITDALYWRYADSVIKSIVPDQEGNLYIHAVVYDQYNALIQRESIYKYSTSSDKLIQIVDYRYPEEQPFMIPYIRNIQASDGGVVYYYYDMSDKSLKQYKYTMVEERVFKQDVPEGMLLMDVLGTEPGEIFFTTRENQVGYISEDLEFEIVKDYLKEGTAIERVESHEGEYHVLTQSGKLDSYALADQLTSMTRISSLPTQSKELMKTYGPQLNRFDELVFSSTLMVRKTGYRLIILGVLALFIYMIRFLYIYIMQRRVWINLKMILVLVPAISMTVLFFMLFTILETFSDVNDDIKDGKYIQFEHIINYQFERIGDEYGPRYVTDYLESLEPYGEMDNQKYATFEDAISLKHVYANGGLDENDIEDLSGMYLVIDIVKEGISYKVLDTENHFRWFTKRDMTSHYFQAVIAGETVHDSTADYIFTLKPIYNENKDVIGIIQVGMNYGGYKKENDEKLLAKIATSMLAIPSIMLPVIVLITFITLRPIGQFTRDVMSINDETLDTPIEMTTHDEIEDLSDAFNSMTSNMSNYINDIKRMSKSYHRFVPQEIFKLLNKETVEEIQLGDRIQLNLTILCAGINHFYELSEKLGHEESFDLINQHLKVIGPIIRRHGGVIDHYSDVGLIAMFPDKSDQAVEAAIEIQKTIQNLKHRGEANYQDIDIAIHKGDVIVGIIGEEKRLQSNMVSDIVNMCLLLQTKAALLASRILISHEAFDALKGTYKNRKLGAIKLMGRENSIEVIDLFEGDAQSELKLKDQSSSLFSQAVGEFKKGEYEQARSNFVRVLEKNMNDHVARLYFYEVDQKMKNHTEEQTATDYQLSI